LGEYYAGSDSRRNRLLFNQNGNPVPRIHLASVNGGAGKSNIDSGDLDVLAIKRLFIGIRFILIPRNFFRIEDYVVAVGSDRK
jgi:hypothetical protein